MIRVLGLRKAFTGKTTTLDGIGLDIGAGEVVALIGL